MELIKQKDHYEVSRCSWASSGELVLVGGRFEAPCPDCAKVVSFESDEILLETAVGGITWVGIDFTCDACEVDWFEERQIQIDISAKFV